MNVKSILRSVLPKTLHPSNLARARIIHASHGKVIAGPFAGQTYITAAEDFIEPGMLMGVYEKELHQTIESLLQDPPELFINIGASQGYYAVGFALRAPNSRHIAFEFYEPRLSQLKRTMAANSTAIELWGKCTKESLQTALEQSANAFVLVDVEGYERELLDPAHIPLLYQARMVIETHEQLANGVTDEIFDRFKRSHSIYVLEPSKRTANDLPFLICDRWTVGQLDEGRSSSQKWLVMHPKN
jgi:hypothetical protein